MATITIAQICDAIETTLGAAPSVRRSASYDEMTEGVHSADAPYLEVYFESLVNQTDANVSDRMTFGGKGGVENTPKREKDITIHVDYYAAQRGHLAENMDAVVTGIDEMVTILEAQNVKPYFNLSGIQSFSWSANRVVFNRGEPSINYAGIRLIIIVRVF